MNEVYFILGASSEVGTAYIKRLEERNRLAADSQITVIAHCRTISNVLKNIINEAKNIHIVPILADLSDDRQMIDMLDTIEKEYGCPTHILHLAASKLEYGKLKNIDWLDIEKDFQIQTASLFMTLQRFLPLMAKKEYGKVAVMLSSVTLGMPPKFMSAYTINKYALLGLMKSAAAEYADKGININGLSPSMMETKFLEHVNEKIVEMSAMQSAKKRNIQVAEVIPSIEYLLSEGSDYMNGVNINLSGGDC